MTQEQIDNVIAERDYLRKKLKEEEDYREYVQKHRCKGYLSGYMTRIMGSSALGEKQSVEFVEQTKMMIRKMANNPVLSEEAHKALDNAIWYMDMYMYYMDKYRSLAKTNELLQKIDFRKGMLKKMLENNDA